MTDAMRLAQADPITLAEVPEGDGYTPICILRTGRVHSRFTGEPLADVDELMIDELARVLNERIAADRVIFDWQHATALSAPPSPPEVSMALGEVVRAWRDGDRLMVEPRWTARGRAVIEASEGLVWPSPEFVDSPVFGRENGQPVGAGQVLAVTLTPRPQQTATTVDAVILNEGAPDAAQEGAPMPLTPEYLASVEAERDDLKAKLADALARLESMDADDDAADADAMGEDADAPVVAQMREQLSDRDAQVATLSESVSALTAQVNALSEANYTVKRDALIDGMIADGRITPAERDAAVRDYDVENRHPEIGYKAFSDRYANRQPQIPVGVVGVPGDAERPDAATAIRTLSERGREILKAARDAGDVNVTLAACIKRAEIDNPELARASRI